MSAKLTSSAKNEVQTTQALLQVDMQAVKGVGPKYAKCLLAKGIRTVWDALFFLPKHYEDRRQTKTIAAFSSGELACFEATVLSVQAKRTRKYRTLIELILSDGTGEVRCIWFRAHVASFRKRYQVGDRVRVAGRLECSGEIRQIVHPDMEKVEQNQNGSAGDQNVPGFGRLVPIYPDVEGLPPKTVRKIIQQAVRSSVDKVTDVLPRPLLEQKGMLGLKQALLQVHFPGQEQDVEALEQRRSAGHVRLIFEEFFLIQVGLACRHERRKMNRSSKVVPPAQLEQVAFELFGFRLTQAQSSALAEIAADMQRARPMNRLLQGDVGSGKTAIALLACMAVAQSGAQTALMVPTEVLAEQHYRSLSHLLCRREGDKLRLGYLTSALNSKARKSTLQRLALGKVDLIIGTQALLQADVRFANLGLVLIDEQHRFGVMQRVQLRDKGRRPHVLVMTATPIPRTLSMTLYGDLDISTVDELPPGRTPVSTKLLRAFQVKQALEHIRQEVKAGGQAFVVYPLVEQSEKLDLLDASRAYQILRQGALSGLRLGLVHGRMAADEKDQTMERFAKGELDVLVCTTVIEVGVDVPNASLMVIEHAERFGLSQLHQLRGRVGRGPRPAHCYLIAHSLGSADARSRLCVMEQTTDGFLIAEQDLAIRGPGEFIGTKQSGLFRFDIADLSRDQQVLQKARLAAFKLVKSDPYLQNPSHQLLRQALEQRLGERLRLAEVG